MIRIMFANRSDARVAAALKAKGPTVVTALESAVDRAMLALQRRIQEKLSGEVLEHRSGKALGSVIKKPTVASEGKISGGVTAGGGPAFYLRIQEKGGTRTYDIYPVNKKALAFFPAGTVGGAIASGTGALLPGKSTVRGLYARSGAAKSSLRPGQLQTFGQLGGVVVKHVVHPPLPARPFMSTALTEQQGAIIERIRGAALDALKA